MGEYPLIFTFNEAVVIKNVKTNVGYFLFVNGRGKALMTTGETGDYWINGVQPGGMSEGGKTVKEALYNFKTAIHNILLDIAGYSENDVDFTKEVKDFFAGIDDNDLKLWEKARKTIKTGEVEINSEISNLKKETEEIKTYINISLIAGVEGAITLPAISKKQESIACEDNYILQNGFLAAA
jgi:predicted RNase H-like HicB family nuclease